MIERTEHGRAWSEAGLRRVFLVLFFLSGFSALLYQVLWFRVLHLILGSTVSATVTVLVAFMAGLALGARLIAPHTPRLRDPLRTYAMLEGVVGLTALFSPAALAGARWIYVSLSPDPVEGGALGLPLFRASLAFLVLLVPTTAMGATLPVLAGRFVRRWEAAGARVGGLYAANLWGAVLGVGLTGFFLLPWLGVRGGINLGAAVTLGIALVAWLLGPRVAVPPAAPPPPQARREAGWRPWLVPALFLLTGFCSFAYEVLWTRLLVLHVGSSAYAFTLMLALFLLGLAFGGALGGWLADRVARPLVLLGGLFAGAALATSLGLQLLRLLPEMLEGAAIALAGTAGLSLSGLVLASAVAVAPILLPTTILIGASFPVGVKALLRDPGRAGETTGRLYAWNTLGNILGAFAGGAILLPAFGAGGGLVAAAGLHACVGAAAILAALPDRRGALAAFGALALAAVALATGLRGDPITTAGIFRMTEEGQTREILYREETPQGLVTVSEVREEAGMWKSLDIDGVNVAGTSPGLVAIQKLQGHLPLLLHPDPRSVLHIGFGSGGTAKAVSTHSGVETIHVVEINPAVVRAAEEWLGEINDGVLEDPRLEVFHEDGRNFLLATEGRYDVILSDAVHPRYAGNSALYSLDYFRMVRERLRQGGLLSMWLPIYGLDQDALKMILRSVREVFPDTSLWYVNSNINEFLIVIGRTGGPRIDVDRLRAGLAEASVHADLASIDAADPLRVVDYLVAQGRDLDPVVLGVPPSRDDRPLVEYLSARTLDRTASWIQSHRLIVETRRPRPDLLEDDPELRDAYLDLYPSTTWNLAGQLEVLWSGHPRVSAEDSEDHLRRAALAFRRADRLAPAEDEPWEWFGLPEAHLEPSP